MEKSLLIYLQTKEKELEEKIEKTNNVNKIMEYSRQLEVIGEIKKENILV